MLFQLISELQQILLECWDPGEFGAGGVNGQDGGLLAMGQTDLVLTILIRAASCRWAAAYIIGDTKGILGSLKTNCSLLPYCPTASYCA